MAKKQYSYGDAVQPVEAAIDRLRSIFHPTSGSYVGSFQCVRCVDLLKPPDFDAVRCVCMIFAELLGCAVAKGEIGLSLQVRRFELILQ